MKKLVMVLFALLIFVGVSNAQRQMSVGAGLVVSMPMGDFGDAANTGFGGTAAFEMGLAPQLVGVANAGYLTWGTDVDDVSWSGVPVTVGVKYYFVPEVPFYGLGQLGLTFLSWDSPYDDQLEDYGYDVETSSTEFTLVIGAGYEVPVAPNVAVDLTAALNVVSDANHFTLRAGVKFGI